MNDLASAFGRMQPRRVHGIAAVLLPYVSGSIDWHGFGQQLRLTRDAGLDCAVNMDTGFGDLLMPDDRAAVLQRTQQALGPGVRFYAGAFADRSMPVHTAYVDSIETIERFGGTPVIVQCAAMHGKTPKEKAEIYAAAVGCASGGALAFELSPKFAPHGEIWDDETFARILEIPRLLGAKHSSLDRTLELGRLAARDAARPEFRVYTGNDLAIDMVVYGSDYLLGLATFAPDRFAARDRLLAEGSAEFLMLNDALQHLGNVGFRAPIPAYKHSAAQFLHLCGRLGGDEIHPKAPLRPGSDRVLLFDCALRLGLIDDPDRVWNDAVLPYLDAGRPG